MALIVIDPAAEEAARQAREDAVRRAQQEVAAQQARQAALAEQRRLEAAERARQDALALFHSDHMPAGNGSSGPLPVFGTGTDVRGVGENGFA